MANRGQVHIEDTGVYLYTYWGARGLPETVSNALARDERWYEPQYLTRIIFDEMTGEDTSTTGYGIGTKQAGDVYRVVHVNCDEQRVRVETGPIPWAGDGSSKERIYTFDEYVSSESIDWPELTV